MADEIVIEGKIVQTASPVPKPRMDRMTLQLNLYQEHIGSNGEHYPVVFSRIIQNSKEQPFKRTYWIGHKWKPLELGWLKDVAGHIIVDNPAGRYSQTLPTEEQKSEIERSVIHLANGTTKEWWEIPPRECHFGLARDATKLQVRAAPGAPDSIEIVVFIVPR